MIIQISRNGPKENIEENVNIIRDKHPENNASTSDKDNFDRSSWKRSVGYRRSKSSNAIETTKKNVTFERNGNNLSNDSHHGLDLQNEKSKGQIKNKSFINKAISHGESNLDQIRNAGDLKKKSFSLMSLVSRKHQDTAITHGDGILKGRKNDIENHKIDDREKGNIQSDKKPKYLTKVVSSSQHRFTNGENGNQARVQSSNNLAPSLSAKVLRF